jgi:two-component system CheB/CheR fusion protein
LNHKKEQILPVEIINDIRKLKAIVTFVVYGLVLLLIKVMYETILEISTPSIIAIISFLASLLFLIIFMLNQVSKNVLKRITIYTTTIEEARKYAEDVVNTVQYPLVLLDSELKIISANLSFYKTFKVESNKTIGKTLFEIGDQQWDISELRNLLEDIKKKELFLNNFEVEQNFPKIGHKIMLLNATQVYSEGKKMFLLSIEDITQRKEFEQKLKKHATEIEIANKSKSDFLANMSHELRTPLNAIIGFSELLKDEMIGQLLPKQKNYITDIFLSGKHLLSLLNDILDLSKIEAGKMTLDLEITDIPLLFESSLSIVKERALRHNIKLNLDIKKDVRQIYVDTRKLKQVIYNLLSNAVKFTPDGGIVSIKVKKVSDLLEFSVEDTGIGISKEDIGNLFQPFEQLESSLNRKHEGTGLGLSLVKSIVELHGGSVKVKSELGKGSCFTVRIHYRTEQN